MTRHPELEEAREGLAYWERRLASLPRRDRRGRREALAAVERARARVTEAERDAYGAGVTGTVLQLAAEGRFPEPLRDTGRRVAKHGRRAALVVATLAVSLTVLVVALTIAVLVALL